MYKTKRTLGLFAFGLFVLFGSTYQHDNASAMIDDSEGNKWWDEVELVDVYNRLSDEYDHLSEDEIAKLKETPEKCSDFEYERLHREDCVRDPYYKFLYQNKDKGYYAANETILTSMYPVTIYPSANRIKYRINSIHDIANNTMTLRQLFIAWNESGKFAVSHDRLVPTSDDDVTHEIEWYQHYAGEGKAQTVVMKNIEGLRDNKNYNFMMTGYWWQNDIYWGDITGGGFTLSVDYSQCVLDKSYVEGMECRSLMNQDGKRQYFPMWEEDEQKHFAKAEDVKTEENKKTEETHIKESDGGENQENKTEENEGAETQNDDENGKSTVNNYYSSVSETYSTEVRPARLDVQKSDDLNKTIAQDASNDEVKSEVGDAKSESGGMTVEIPELGSDEAKQNFPWWTLLIIGALAATVVWLLILLFVRSRGKDEKEER